MSLHISLPFIIILWPEGLLVVRLFSLLGDMTTHWQLSLLAELVWDRDSERQVAVGRQAAVDIQLATLPGEISFLWHGMA